MMCVNGEGWIGNTYYPYIGYLPAKDCKNNKENFLPELKKEIMDNIKLVTEIQEGYYRHVKSGFWEKSEFGDYCYKPCSKGKGATLYYFAAFEFVKENVKNVVKNTVLIIVRIKRRKYDRGRNKKKK